MQGVTDQIKEKIDIVDFISAYVQLRKAGRNYVGFCPFHPNARTPAFTVFPDTQSFHCFGCKASGTVFDFLMRREGLEFREALEQLARRAGIELRERTPEEQQLDQLRTRLLEVNAAAAAFFRHMLVKSPRGEEARAYVARRAIDEPTSEAFLLGYAPEEWTLLLGYLTGRKGFAPEEVQAAGLAIHHETRGFYDRFRDRLMFPIRNARGEVVGFGGRALGDAQPKYMNTPQTPLFDKSTVLYGLDLARDAIRNADATVIVEGYVDVIIAHQHGFRNVVAPLGTALTAEHVGLVKKLAHTVYLALDADAAGVRATLKGLQSLQEHPEGELVAVASPQGIVGFQRRLEVEIKILALPDGRDPDEVIRHSPAEWRALLAAARPAMDFYMQALTADLDLTTGRGKAAAVERIAPLLAQVASPVEQAHHIQQLARLIDVDEKHVLAALAGQRPDTKGRGAPVRGGAHVPPLAQPSASSAESPERKTQNAARTTPGVSAQEDALLGLLLRYPAARAAVEEKLRRDVTPFPHVHEVIAGEVAELFTRVEHRAIWEAWRHAPTGADPEPWAELLDEALAPHARRALQRSIPQSQSYRFVNDALECATILQQGLAKRWKDRISRQAAEADDEAERGVALERLVQLKQYIDAISTPRRSSTYTDLHSLHPL
ncbi:MAG TPA: DNA primase [Roseiflexaceae bacterium]|nr:DNA primase [Roseiflexaceae bacterium]